MIMTLMLVKGGMFPHYDDCLLVSVGGTKSVGFNPDPILTGEMDIYTYQRHACDQCNMLS